MAPSPEVQLGATSPHKILIPVFEEPNPHLFLFVCLFYKSVYLKTIGSLSVES